MPPKGSYAGKILRVDLSTGKVEKKELDLAFAHKHIGGRGFASWYLYNEVPPEVSPFDPANRLIFTPGALFGTAVPAASRTTATSKSPVTGMFGDGHSSGHWGAVLKSAGYDMLLLQGAAEKPVYLWIDNDRVEMRDAAPLWGRATMETDRVLRETLGSEIGTLVIGPAGEKRVRLAGIFSDGIMGTFARTGLGAVMGSKNLKAVAARGNRDVGIDERGGVPEGLPGLSPGHLRRPVRAAGDEIRDRPFHVPPGEVRHSRGEELAPRGFRLEAPGPRGLPERLPDQGQRLPHVPGALPQGIPHSRRKVRRNGHEAGMGDDRPVHDLRGERSRGGDLFQPPLQPVRPGRGRRRGHGRLRDGVLRERVADR